MINIRIPAQKIKEPKLSKVSQKTQLEDFVKIEPRYLIHLHSSWLKYTEIETGICHTGGFLVSCDFNTSVPTVLLRIPSKKEIIEIETKKHEWYVKKNLPNYISILNVLIIPNERKRLNM
jgi:hypothetical protein